MPPSYTAPNIPTRHRPIFEGLATDEEIYAAATQEYERLKEVDDEGLDFSNKTAQWIAFERQVESQREDALFCDPLAQYLSEPYGQRLSNSMSFGLKYGCFDPPGANIGLGLEGHVMYTAARTKLINDYLTQWVTQKGTTHKKQVVNVGAGMDTRPYWLPCLRNVESYWEIDTAAVMKDKQKRLQDARNENKKGAEKLPTAPLCPVHSISMDFTKESIADLPTRHGYDSNVPCCWILEGLIMYLERTAVEQLMDTISQLSPSDSFILLNFSTNMPKTTSPSIEELDERLNEWKKVAHLMFGQEGFHFNRYPVGKPANKIVGLAMYQKE